MGKKLIRMAIGNDWAVVIVTVSLLFQTATGVSVQTNEPVNTKSESNQVVEVKKREDMGRASIFTPRVVGDDELVEKRSEIEDRLRKRLLAASGPGAFSELLNAPWNEQTVEQFGKLVIPESGKEVAYLYANLRVNEPQWAGIMYLLAFVATTHRDQPVGLCAAEAFDRAMAWTARKRYARHWFYCVAAIGMYGSSDLLTPTFWKAQDQGLDCYEAFHGLGLENKKELMKLNNPDQQALASDELIAIGHAFKRANMPIPQHRYGGVRTKSVDTNSVEEIRVTRQSTNRINDGGGNRY